MKFGTLAALAVCGVALSGCAAHIVEASQSACESFGFSPGTDAFSQCVHQEVAMRDDAVNRAPLSARGGLQGPQVPSSSTVGGVTPGVPVLKSSYLSGGNKVCLYSQAGNEVAVTIGAEAACAPTLQ
jgi:hypothetical protein